MSVSESLAQPLSSNLNDHLLVSFENESVRPNPDCSERKQSLKTGTLYSPILRPSESNNQLSLEPPALVHYLSESCPCCLLTIFTANTRTLTQCLFCLLFHMHILRKIKTHTSWAWVIIRQASLLYSKDYSYIILWHG